MFSRRVSHSPVQWLHNILSVRYLLWVLPLMIAVGLAFGFIGVSARWKNANGTGRQGKPEAFALLATAMRPVSKQNINPTPVVTVSAASYDGIAVAPDSIVTAYGQQLATQTTIAIDSDPSTPGITLP